MQWLCLEDTEREMPTWASRCFVDDDGTIYLPAFLAAKENKVFLMAAFDNVSLVVQDGHLYAPSGWLRETYPAIKFGPIEDRIRAFLAETEGAR